MKELDPARLRLLLAYDPRTGELRWKTRPEAMFRSPQSRRTWNTRYAGKIATRVRSGYFQVHIDETSVSAARVIWAIVTGGSPGFQEIDHINGVKTDNRWTNLRLATRAQNSRNTKVRRKGLKGAYFSAQRDRWQALICKDRRLFHLGYFKTEIEAHAAYCRASAEKHGIFGRVA